MKRIILAVGLVAGFAACAKQTPPPANPCNTGGAAANPCNTGGAAANPCNPGGQPAGGANPCQKKGW